MSVNNNGNMEYGSDDPRRLLIGEHVSICVKPTGTTSYSMLGVSIPRDALIAYSPTAAADLASSKNVYVFTIKDAQPADVEEIIKWIVSNCEGGSPATIAPVRINPIAETFRKYLLAKRLGIVELETVYVNSINHILLNKNVHAYDAHEVYQNYSPLDQICWKVAKSMAYFIHNNKLSTAEQNQYARIRYQVPNLDDNIKIHDAETRKGDVNQ